MTSARMIRYEIECGVPGHIIDAPGIRKVAATQGGRTKKPVVIVYVADVDRKEFEKVVENDPRVVGYDAYPEGDPKGDVTFIRVNAVRA